LDRTISKEESSQSYEYSSRLLTITSLDSIVDNLSSTRSYYPIYHPSDLGGINTPCCVGIQFMLKAGGYLNLYVILRSNDMQNAWPLNIMGFRRIQEQVYDRYRAKLLTQNRIINLGTITTISLNAHIYDLEYTHTDPIIEDYNDIDGYYTFEKSNDLYQVKYYNRNSDLITLFENSDYEALIEEVSITIRSPSHAAYVGKEITKLYYANKI